MTPTAEAAIYILIGTLISTIGAWVTARINSTAEKPTESLSIVIRELRIENAELTKEKNNLEAVMSKRDIDHRESITVMRRDRDRYASYALEVRRLLRKHAPNIDVPDEENGTPPSNTDMKGIK